jgi:hypothetical protein
MSRNETALAVSVAWIGVFLGLLPQAAHAQAFARATSSLTDYSKSDLEPRCMRKPCGVQGQGTRPSGASCRRQRIAGALPRQWRARPRLPSR